MRNYSILCVLFCVQFLLAQNPEIKTDLPTIIPPSPSVSALMKFEEVPVSNYTGVPNISIPLFTTPTLSKDIAISLSLNYHSGVGANDVAGDAGLGWSLFAGGTVSRTVRSLPDEQLEMDSQGLGKVGLYHTIINNHKNYYYQYYQPDNGAASMFANAQPYEANRYLWETIEHGKFDTEHDLWQFNFMNKSGRFYIEKDLATNTLKIVPLDDYRVKIVNHYTTVGNNPYVPTGFTIYDESGYEYRFEIFENTRNKQAVSNVFTIASNNDTSISVEKEFRSSFHLTKIYDNNNELLVEFFFSNATDDYKECTSNNTLTHNDYNAGIAINGVSGTEMMSKYNCFNEFKPIRSMVGQSSVIDVKKIKTIHVSNVAKIDISYIKGRQDNNISLNNKAVRIDKITVRNWAEQFIKKYKLDYGYSTVIKKRMVLNSVSELNENENIVNNKHEFFYRQNDTTGYNIGKDAWGYFNLTPTCYSADISFLTEPSPTFSTSDVLQKIKYPTGGCAIFNFEANTYSFIGDEVVTDFDKNQDNYHQTYYNPPPQTFNDSTSIYYEIPTASVDRYVRLEPSIILQDEADDTFILQKFNGSGWHTESYGLYCLSNNENCCYELTLLANTSYRIWRSFTNAGSAPDATIGIEYYEKNQDIKEYLYGGGNRIKQIGYFEQDVPQNYFQDAEVQNEFALTKQKLYDYNWPGNSFKSSGSLAFLKPLYQYLNSSFIAAACPEPPYYGNGGVPGGVVFFNTNTNFNNLNFLKTQGADIGYKYVSVSETGNGSTHYEYKSPIDEPEEYLFTNSPPFLPSKNIDYRRGLLMNEIIKDEQLRPLKETTFTYAIVNYEKKYGIRLEKTQGLNCFGPNSIFGTYNSYLTALTYPGPYGGFGSGNTFNTASLCGYPVEYLQFYPLIQAYGWAKLASKTTKDYFYNQSNTQRIVETKEEYDYHNFNKMISESTVTNSLGEVLTSKYFYHTGSTSTTRNRISEIERIETYRGSELLSTSQINYANNWAGNVSYLPQVITTSKGEASLENRVRFNLYDDYSNPLEVQQENGTVVSYIWGYNKTQAVAKIENLGYNSIPSNLITDIQNATDNQTEASVISALNLLRSNPALNGAMVTTYTYKPLVGVSTITDPKGDKMTYMYDDFQRLEAVYDKAGNKLSENEYNYRTQN